MEYKYIIFNLRKNRSEEYSWDNLPDWFWSLFIDNLGKFGITKIGFERVVDQKDMDKSGLQDYLKEAGKLKYDPFHTRNESSIQGFYLTEQLKEKLKTIPLVYFNAIEEDLPFDEIIFFKDDSEKFLVVPYENFVMLKNFSESEYDILMSIDKRFIGNIDSFN
ncbi:hypothetical protein [Xanthocytophaga agilis]|uniref:Uncharacterized protein n=1 Tax=Xanthocytophaga agilis TaxID=3048010 RepID=A0AAE3R5R5_9BACT|nr:hypothetical protein [Xanthocytophaga agilis]MDJ1501964.1 hypothetical protein [Xanthocytophaga agilis]